MKRFILVLFLSVGFLLRAADQYSCTVTDNVQVDVLQKNTDNVFLKISNTNDYKVNVTVWVKHRGEQVSDEQHFVLNPKETKSNQKVIHWGAEKDNFKQDYLSVGHVVIKCD